MNAHRRVHAMQNYAARRFFFFLFVHEHKHFCFQKKNLSFICLDLRTRVIFFF